MIGCSHPPALVPTSPLARRLVMPPKHDNYTRSMAASPAGVRMLMSRLPALSESASLEEEQPLLPPRTSSRIVPAAGQVSSRGPVLPPRHEQYRTPPRSLYHDRVTPPRSLRSAPPTGPAPPPPQQSVPLHPPLPAHIGQRRVAEAMVRTNAKLRVPGKYCHLICNNLLSILF